MAKLRLTKPIVETLLPTAKETVVWDATLAGFGVRVKPSGSRTYIVQYRNRVTGASRRMTLGRHGVITLDQARKQARLILADAQQGKDPVEDRRQARQAPVMTDLANDYLSRHAIPMKRATSLRHDRAILDKIILPKLGRKKVELVTRRDIEALHVALQDRPYQANRMLALLSKMFNLAVQWAWRTNNPAKGIPRFHEEQRDRYLSDAELYRLCDALVQHPNERAANAVRLQLLTGARIGEVLRARWQDFDIGEGIWTKPSHHTKQNRRERVPLSPQALQLIEEMRTKSDLVSPYLFPGDAPDKPLQDIKKFWRSVKMRADIKDYRLHDNRHTYASHLVSSGLSLEIIGRLMGHTSPTTTKRYAHLIEDPLRAATTRFGDKVEGLQSGQDAEVVPLRRSS